ncbi:MAG: glycosyltransferase [Flavitalea sp.]
MVQNEKINTGKEKPLFLVSPLDWGLGHTTRCIPLIREMLKSGATVIIACNSIQKKLLSPEFPEVRFVHLDGYELKYGRNKLFTAFLITLQAPKILIKIKKENFWIHQFLLKTPVNAVISDNRYGFFAQKTPSVFITHQLYIRTGASHLINLLIQRFTYQFISRFSECWIPDFKGSDNAAGKLSHPALLPSIPTYYIGCLSRFIQRPSSLLYDRLIILSGPEPQRTILENRILLQLKNLPGRSALVRGIPGNNDVLPQIKGTLIINHAGAEELNKLIESSSLIISRSGYTTVMDLLKLKKKMILIPTPGQQEQEYLGKYLQSKKWALTIHQKNFSIAEAESQAKNFDFQFTEANMELYKETIGRFINNLTAIS